MEIKKHNINLISIKGVFSQTFFYDILVDIHLNNLMYYLQVSHNEYKIDIPFDLFKDGKDYYSILLKNDDLIESSKILYYTFLNFQFFSLLITNSSLLEGNFHLEKIIKAKELANNKKGFVFYKSMEPDVIWVIKHKDLDFGSLCCSKSWLH